MATAQLQIVNDSGVVIISNTRKSFALIQKGGSEPAGKVFKAEGPGGISYWFGFPTPGSSNCGFQIFDPSGTCMFDAMGFGKLGKPVGAMFGSLGIGEPDITITKTFAVPAGKTYAVWIHHVPSAFRVRPVTTKVGTNINYQYFLDDQQIYLSFTSSLITLTASRTNDTARQGMGNSVPYTGGMDPTFRAIVLDVTNF